MRGAAVGTLPMKVVMYYLVTTFALFLIWPINWPIYSWEQWAFLTFYVALCFGTLMILFKAGARGVATPLESGPPARLLIAGALLAITLLIPSSYFYTGQWPWEVLSALQQQGDAYRRFQEQLVETTGQRGPIALARAFAAPLTFAVLPLGLIHWRSLSWGMRGLVLATAACAVIFSLMRGTDREMAELFIVSASAFLIVVGRDSSVAATIRLAIRRYWKAFAVAAVLLVVAASLFTVRKAERLGQVHTVCANDSRICADLDAPAISWLDERAKFSTSIFILSSCSGYYGLALGLEKDFRSTFGFGHSPYVLAAYRQLTGDESLQARAYTSRNFFDGWSPDFYWSTAILWIANDVGFIGAVLVLALVGYAWGRSWRDATAGRNDAAAVVFCIIMLAMFQLPSTNSVLSALDGYLILIVWITAWKRTQSRASDAARSVARHTRPAPSLLA